MLARVEQPSLIRIDGRKFEAFEFQNQMVEDLHEHIGNGFHRICMIAPTGAGKTFVAATILKEASEMGCKSVFLVKLNCLLDQTAREFRELGIRCSVFQASRAVDWTSDVIIASLQTVTARLKKQSVEEIFGDEVSLFFCDEAHESSFDKSYIAIEKTYLPQEGTFIGLTGSPWRSSPKQGLSERFDATVVAPQPPELVKLGRIVPARIFHPGDVFTPADLDVRQGDYVTSQVEAQAMKSASLESVVRNWIEKGDNRPTVAFCPGVKTAEALCAAFVSHGIAAEWQCGETRMGRAGKAEHERGELTRAAQDYRLANGITKVLCNVATLTAGWNVPEVSLVIFYMETLSRCRWIQATGRGSRTCNRIGKTDFWVHDYGSNGVRFGSPTGYQNYSIQPRGKSGAAGSIGLKSCPDCNELVSNLTQVCPHCGYEFVKDLESEAKQEDLGLDVELSEYFDEAAKRQVKFLRDAKRFCFTGGMSKDQVTPDLPVDDFKRAYGFIPPKEWHLGACCGLRPTAAKRAAYEEYLRKFAKSDHWFNWHMRLEFGPGEAQSGQQSLFKEKAKWWEVLGVSDRCGRAEAKAAYRDLALQYHPDVCGESDAEEKMKLVNRAWDEACKFFGGQTL